MDREELKKKILDIIYDSPRKCEVIDGLSYELDFKDEDSVVEEIILLVKENKKE